MKIERLHQPTPVIVIDDFLPKHEAEAVYRECVDLRPVYREAEVLGNQAGVSLKNPSVRRNEVVYLDDIFKNNVSRCKIFGLVRDGIYKQANLWAEGNTGFEMINQATRWETVLSRYGNGDFYDFHRDYNFAKSNRLITAVYYAHNESFTGGRLVLKSWGELLPLEAKHNRLVVFNSGCYHAVEKTEITNDTFDNGRFSVNIWIGFQS